MRRKATKRLLLPYLCRKITPRRPAAFRQKPRAARHRLRHPILRYEHEPRNTAHRAPQYRLEHHRAAHGHRIDRHRRTLGSRLRRHDRRAGHRRLDLQLHLLELLVRAHGNQRADGPGVRRGRLPRVHQHAGPRAVGVGGDGCADDPAPIPRGRTGPLGHERQRNDPRLLLRPHLGRAGGHRALRVQRLVHGDAERHIPHADGRHGQHRAHPLQPLVRLRDGYGHRGHRLRLGDRPMDRRGALGAAARRQIPSDPHRDRLVGGAGPQTAEDVLHHQPRHHPAHVLHRRGLHLLHRGVGTHGRPRCWP